MFIDICGYTKKSTTMSLPEIMSYLKDYEEIVLPLIETHCGKIIKKMGDGLMISFPNAIYSCLCGVRILDKLKNYNMFKQEKNKISIRIGVNAGQVAVRGNDVFGDVVNMASRLESNGTPGEITITELLNKSISQFFETKDVGTKTIKGKAEPVHLYQVKSALPNFPKEKDPTVSGKKDIQEIVDKESEYFKQKKKIDLVISFDDEDRKKFSLLVRNYYREILTLVEDIPKNPEHYKNQLYDCIVKQWGILKKYLK